MRSAKAVMEGKLFSDTARLERRIAELKKDSAELALDEKAVAHQQKHPDMSYSEALEVAMCENPDLAAKYAESFGHLSAEQVKTFGIAGDYEGEDAGSIAAEKQLDDLTLAWLENHPTVKDYRAALDIVMGQHPDLAMLWLKRYSAGTHPRTGAPYRAPQSMVMDDDDTSKSAGTKLDEIATRIQREHPSWSYEKCLGKALEDHPDLKKVYESRG